MFLYIVTTSCLKNTRCYINLRNNSLLDHEYNSDDDDDDDMQTIYDVLLPNLMFLLNLYIWW